MLPERVGPYEILGLLGRGGLGSVYRAFDEASGEEVALKLLTRAPAGESRSAKRFQLEFEALAALDHPNIVQVFDAGFEDGMPYYTMELIEGLDIRRYLDGVVDDPRGTLSSSGSLPRATAPWDDTAPDPSEESGAFDMDAWLAEPDSDVLLGRDPSPVKDSQLLGAAMAAPSIDVPYDSLASAPEPFERPDLEAARHISAINSPVRIMRIRELMAQVCEGLAYIHSRGLVHRDLKPSNIMVDPESNARLMDFGLLKVLSDGGEVTDAGQVVGTYRYMSPEQASGEALDARSDLYAVGVLLYELLAGRPPFLSKNPLDLWRELLESEPPPLRGLNPSVDYQLARVAHTLLRKNPSSRLQTAEEVMEVLVGAGGLY